MIVVVKDGFAVVGDSDGAGGLEGRVVGERLAEGAAGCRRDGEDASGSTALRTCIQRMISGESLTGTVLGIAQTLVKPPAAAAAVPVAMVSL